MQEDNIKEIINDVKILAATRKNPLTRLALESIANRLQALCDKGTYFTPEAARDVAQTHLDAVLMNPPFGRTLKMPVISMPGKAAIKYKVEDPGLPRLAASIETIKSDSGKVSCDCTLFVGSEALADMQVYRGKNFAVRMCKQALKGAMSRLGKHRRMTANRQSRKAAKKEEK